jgi:restriction system protein
VGFLAALILIVLCISALIDRPPSTLLQVRNGYEYERYCAARLEDAGWSCTVTRASGDQGVDIVAKKNGMRAAIQCKFYTSAVGNKAVQEVIAGAIYSGSSFKIVISSSGFTSSAVDLARAATVYLISHDDIPKLDEMIKLECQVYNFISGLRQ